MKIKTVIGLTKRVALLGLVLGVSMTSCGKKDQQGQQQQAAPQIGFITVTKSSADLESVYPATITEGCADTSTSFRIHYKGLRRRRSASVGRTGAVCH